MTALVLATLLFAGHPSQDSPVAAPGHWPQLRGPARDGVSTEKNLLREWPAEGPTLLWKATGIGEGIGCVSVAGGLVFVQGNLEGTHVVTALDGRGRAVWAAPVGPASGEHPGMRFVTLRSPSVDDRLLFVTTWQGMIECLESTTGRILWRKDYKADLGGEAMGWGFGDGPLIEENVVVCAPGGSKGTLAALNKKNGAVVWQSAQIKDRINAPVAVAEIGGMRQYVLLTYNSVAGIDPAKGTLLWRTERPGQTAVVTAPVCHDGMIFVSSGFGLGCNAYRVTKELAGFKVEELYSGRQLENHNGGIVRIGDHLYGASPSDLRCIEMKTGTLAWQARSVGKGAILAADGMLYYKGEQGMVALIEPTPEGYRERGRFTLPGKAHAPASPPVVAGGLLYIRQEGELFCYDVRGPDWKLPAPVWNLIPLVGVKPGGPSLPPLRGKAPDAAFVATPQDIVERMLEVATVTKADVVCDLGSGDGRIPITASKKYGCASVGYEIDAELLKLSRGKLKEAGLDSLVSFVEKDLFTADLSSATVVTLYLGESNNAKLLPKLRDLKPGVRIISHNHLLGKDGPQPDHTVRMTSKEDGSEHAIHLWTLPLAR